MVGSQSHVEQLRTASLVWWSINPSSTCLSWSIYFFISCWNFFFFGSSQDYKQQRPSQELIAKDLHGVEWRFRHIYRGKISSWLPSYQLIVWYAVPTWYYFEGYSMQRVVKRKSCLFNSLPCLIFLRSTSKAFAYYRMEHFCEPKGSHLRRCSSFSQVLKELYWSKQTIDNSVALLMTCNGSFQRRRWRVEVGNTKSP